MTKAQGYKLQLEDVTTELFFCARLFFLSALHAQSYCVTWQHRRTTAWGNTCQRKSHKDLEPSVRPLSESLRNRSRVLEFRVNWETSGTQDR